MPTTHLLLTDDLHQNPFAATPIELPVEDLFPGTKVQLAIGDRHHHFATHDLPFYMSVGVVLTGIVMPILADGFMRCELLKPLGVIVVQA